MENNKLSELTTLCWEIHKIASQCPTVDEGLKVLVYSLTAFIECNSDNKIESDMLTDKCINHLLKFKDMVSEGGAE